MSLLPWVCCMTLIYAEPASVVRTYSGVLSDVDGDAETPVMEFNVISLTAPQDNSRQLDFIVLQDADVSLPWHGRFGRQTHTTSGEVSGRALEVQLTYDNRNLVRELPPLMVLRSDLVEGFEWTDGNAVYTVTGAVTVGGRECWLIEANNRIGYFRTLQVDQETGTVVAAHERVFMGQGDEFALEIHLTAERETDPEQMERNTEVIQQLLDSQALVGDSESSFPELDSDETWEQVVTRLQELSADTEYANLVAGMAREYQQYSRLTAGVTQLAEATVGQPAPAFTLELLGGGTSTVEERSSKVVVLHFWEYQNEQLEEPYGQVGYVDFLANRLKNDPVTFLGVAVNRGLNDSETRPAAIRSTRALKQFMNLGYPIGFDNGDIIAEFGDPRAVDATLPLWIVISPTGEVTHYHAGHYEIDVNRGLEELESEIRELLPAAP